MAMRLKLEFQDEVSKKLEKLAKRSPQAFMRVLDGIALETKTYVIARQRNQFVSHARTLEKGTRYKRKMVSNSVKLQMRPRYQVLEYGATIVPVNKKALHFITKDGTEVFTKKVLIKPRPYFKPGVKDAIRADVINTVAERLYKIEAAKVGLK